MPPVGLSWIASWAVVATLTLQAPDHVRIRTPDGFQLAARFYAASGPAPGVLLLHQCNRRGSESGFERLAPALAARGMHALELDTRGFGESRDSRFPDYRSREQLIDALIGDDVRAAVAFLQEQDGVAEGGLGVLGASCGTWQAIPVARGDPAIRALVFLSGTYLGLDQVEADCEQITDRPVLAIYAVDDRYGTPDSMRAAFAASRHPASRLIAYKGALHGAPLLRHDPGLEGTIVGWFDEHLHGSVER